MSHPGRSNLPIDATSRPPSDTSAFVPPNTSLSVSFPRIATSTIVFPRTSISCSRVKALCSCCHQPHTRGEWRTASCALDSSDETAATSKRSHIHSDQSSSMSLVMAPHVVCPIVTPDLLPILILVVVCRLQTLTPESALPESCKHCPRTSGQSDHSNVQSCLPFRGNPLFFWLHCQQPPQSTKKPPMRPSVGVMCIS